MAKLADFIFEKMNMENRFEKHMKCATDSSEIKDSVKN